MSRSLFIMLFTLAVSLLVVDSTWNLNRNARHKRQKSVSCRNKYVPLTECVDEVEDFIREVINLYKQDQISEVNRRVEIWEKDFYMRCSAVMNEYKTCCTEEGDCSMMEELEKARKPELQEIIKEMWKEEELARNRLEEKTKIVEDQVEQAIENF